jgi:hypothetical protein
MASATLISASEYLATSYRPDCDLVDGQLIGRNIGEFDHSKLQGTIAAWFYNHQREWNIHVLPEQRVQVRQNCVDDYLNFGVANIWILDPEAHCSYICDRTGFHQPQKPVLEIPGTPITIHPADLFAELD